MLFSPSVLSDSLWPHGLQPTRLPILHHLLEFGQTHVHWVSDAIQPSHPLSSPSHAFQLSQHQGLFQWVSSPHQVAKVSGQSIWSFSFSISPSNEYSGLISFRIDWFDLLAVQGLSRVFSSTTLQKLQFFCAQPSLNIKMKTFIENFLLFPHQF